MSKIRLHRAGHGTGHHRADGDDGSDGEAHGAGPTSQWHGHLELIITIALGLAAVVGAFAAYKNEQRNHHATAEFSHGIADFDDAGQLYATANATLSRDQSQFLAYVTAVHDKKAHLATYIFNNVMDPTLRAAIQWWQSPANLRQANPSRTPFTNKNPKYSIPQAVQAQHSTDSSKANFEDAKRQQDNADHFTLVEVILATALFLYGIAGVTRDMTVKLGTLAIGGVIFLVSLVLLATG